MHSTRPAPRASAPARASSLLAAVTAALLAVAALIGAAPAQAAGATDLTVTLSGPQQVTGSSERSYDLVVRNVGGPSAADGATVALSSSGAATIESVSCAGDSPLSCASASVRGRSVLMERLPVGGEYRFTVVVSFAQVSDGQSASASVEASVEPPEGVTDTNPASNRASVGQTVTPTKPLKVSVAMQGPDQARLGEPLTRRVTVTNEGDAATATVKLWRSESSYEHSVIWSVKCVSAEGVDCPPASAWAPAGQDPGAISLGKLPTGAVVILEVTAVYTQVKCSTRDDASLRLFADVDLNDRRPNVGASRASHEAILTGLERCATVNLSVDASAPAALDLSKDHLYETTVTYFNNGPATETAELSRRRFDMVYVLDYSDEKLTCTAEGMSCPDPVSDRMTVDMPPGATLTLHYSAQVHQSKCMTSTSAALYQDGDIAYAGTEGKHNDGQPSFDRAMTELSGLTLCVQRQASTRTELPAVAWLGDDVVVRQHFKNTSGERVSFRLSDDRVLSLSYPGSQVQSARVRCLSDLCPPEYPAGESIEAGARGGLMSENEALWLEADEEITLEKTLVFSSAQGQCPASGELTVRFDLGMRAAADGEVGGAGSYDTYTLKCKDDTLAVAIDRADPGAETTLSVEVGNAGGVPREQPVKVVLPRDGIFVDPAALARAVCVAAGSAVACPEPRYDAASHTLELTFTDVGIGQTVLAKIPVTLGVKPRAGGASYPIVATVGAGHGEVSPSSNRSVTSVGIDNAKVPVGLNVSVQGASPTADVGIRGVMTCRFQEEFGFDGVLRVGGTSLSLPAVELYPGDTCSLRLEDAEGATWVSGQVQDERGVDGAFTWEAVLAGSEPVVATPTGTPTASGASSETPSASGASSETPSESPSESVSESESASGAPSESPTAPASSGTTETPGESETASETPPVSATPTVTPTASESSGSTDTPVQSQTGSATATASEPSSDTPTHSSSEAASPSPTASRSSAHGGPEPSSAGSRTTTRPSDGDSTRTRGPKDDLARTGASVHPLLFLGVLGLLCGGAVLFLTRRRAKH